MARTDTQTQSHLPTISSNRRLTAGEMDIMLSHFRSAQCKLDAASGIVVAAEVRMRLIGQFSELVRNNLAAVVAKSTKKGKSDKYWDCDLEFLDKAIDAAFSADLESSELQQIAQFRPLRNKLLHGDFVNLMDLMKIVPTGRQITISASQTTRNILEARDIEEAIKSIERNDGLEKIRQHATAVVGILDKIIIGLAHNGQKCQKAFIQDSQTHRCSIVVGRPRYTK